MSTIPLKLFREFWNILNEEEQEYFGHLMTQKIEYAKKRRITKNIPPVPGMRWSEISGEWLTEEQADNEDLYGNSDGPGDD